MTREDIIRMAREAGIPDDNIPALAWGRLETGKELLERFATIVISAEREACADILDRNADKCDPCSIVFDVLDSNAKAIRARGQQ